MSVASASFSAKMALSSANINLVADWSSVKQTVAIEGPAQNCIDHDVEEQRYYITLPDTSPDFKFSRKDISYAHKHGRAVVGQLEEGNDLLGDMFCF